ncbi:glycoside hydrolase 43 family protein [Chitinophaga sp. sic0106]|uniref:glycoside hydrolase family 43 protein n=1 Tax=Chitinophaga sp. sic0106 TaxID=2854785 RepID=UPI001C4857D5|nr:glycoside hydrolase 43 family protein [Chitinophaga sp. sic0106]MBV7530302.1 glycoside hydrolase 43 family protein [Chitinophaga sp. sic0106]
MKKVWLTYVLLPAGISLFALSPASAQSGNDVSKVWVADNGNGTYKNPVLYADYSDPDAIRVGDDYYLIASSFDAIPGLPILHSKDLVNWRIAGHALLRQPPYDHFAKTQHGNGVWAPAIRYHNNEFYIYYPDPDFGIYLTKAKNINGPWSEPELVAGGKGLIDPCPLWDDDGKVYLAHAYAGSRAGIKSIIVVKQLNAAGTKAIDEGVMVFDGHDGNPTLEGPKFYKRNGYYYLFAPAGGVSTGWQLVMRSKNIYGPYDSKNVMDQGKSPINGPHQGAWVQTQKGADWFLHFQDIDAYGRVVHLQPMTWVNDWPVIGEDKDKDGKGEPVLTYRKPDVGKTWPITTPAESDEFNDNTIGKQWQWQANPFAGWAFPSSAKGSLRLFAAQVPDSTNSLWDVPNVLAQKFPAEEFTATVKFKFTPRLPGDRMSFIVLGLDYAGLAVENRADGIYLTSLRCAQADKGKKEQTEQVGKLTGTDIFFRVQVTKGGKCNFSYSTDGSTFQVAGNEFTAKPGKWIGAKLGLCCSRTAKTNDAGFADVDWFRITK